MRLDYFRTCVYIATVLKQVNDPSWVYWVYRAAEAKKFLLDETIIFNYKHSA